MRLPILDLIKGTTLGQFYKVEEEFKELFETRLMNEKYQLEECLDLIQASMGLLLMLTQTQAGLENAMLKHCLKLQRREAKGSFKIKSWLNITIEEDMQNG